MTTTESRPPLQPGEQAPDFTLPAIDRDGTVSLGDYRGRSPVLLAMFRGVYCPFCRRAIAQMAMTRDTLQAAGVESLAIVASKPERARLYFRYRPTRVPLAADPGLVTHRAFGIPRPAVTPEFMEGMGTVRTNASGELPEPLPIRDALNALDTLDRFEFTETDSEEADRQFPQLGGQFLVDRAGVIRWTNIECADEGLAGVGKFPSRDELLEAVRALPG